MKNVIIGTSGHIDHGKTTLIKALTNRSTDTLQEEIRRGISIDLGFTYFDLPSGKRAGIIDVPGHEKFIKNMLAGATGIDIVLLTIAANEGIKPQTAEHIDILGYLNIKNAVIVLTKADLADSIMTELVTDDIKEKVAGTFLQDAPILPVDSLSKKGLDKLVATIDELSKKTEARNDQAPPRLNIDRVFSLKGFGTVVTGTLSEGRINLEDELTVYPKGLKTKIRSIQVHEESVKTAYAGQRTALNISNVKPDQIKRGDVLARSGALTPTMYLDAKISLLPHSQRAIRYWERVRLYLGSKEILARVVLMQGQIVNPGESTYCQLRLEEPIAAKKNDRFVIRYYSPMETIGGGVILDPLTKKHAANQEILQALQIKETGDPSDVAGDFIAGNKEKPTKVQDLAAYISTNEDTVRELLKNLQEQGIIFEMSSGYYHCNTLELFKEDVLEILDRYHCSYPLQPGMPKEELRSKASLSFKAREFEQLLNILENQSLVKNVNTAVAIAKFEIVYDKKMSAIKTEIENMLENGKFTPPTISELTKGGKGHIEVLNALIASGSITKLDDQTVIHSLYYEKAVSIVTDFIEKNGEISLGQFRDITGSSRKYSMIILEDFDKKRLTKRVGENRVLHNRPVL